MLAVTNSVQTPRPKTIAVFFTKPGFDSEPFDHPGYRAAYHELAKTLEGKGGRLCIVRDEETYRGGNAFAGGWEFRDGDFREVDEPVEADLLFRKGRFNPDASANVINETAFDDLCTDKSKTYAMFRHLCPGSTVVTGAEELEESLRTTRAPIVAKPLDREGGEGVIIGDVQMIRKHVREFPYIIQEFIDTSDGIPGITDARHDLRLLSMGGTLVACTLRTPKKDSYLANASQGGSIVEVPLASLPEEPLRIFREVDAELAHFPRRIYSVDMGRHADGAWKIIELNAQPGLFIHDLKDDGKLFTGRLADFLLAAA